MLDVDNIVEEAEVRVVHPHRSSVGTADAPLKLHVPGRHRLADESERSVACRTASGSGPLSSPAWLECCAASTGTSIEAAARSDAAVTHEIRCPAFISVLLPAWSRWPLVAWGKRKRRA